MDFWDVAKVLARRWFISVPLLILTLVACAVVAIKTPPDYVATVHVALVPGFSERPTDPGRTAIHNPWEPGPLAEAVIIPLNAKQLADTMKAAGFKSTWTAETGIGELAVVTIAATGPSPAEAVRTAQYLQGLVDADVKQRQSGFRLTVGETIRAQPIETTPTVEKKSTKIIRVIVVLGAAGLILSLGLVLAIDAAIRRRQRKRMASTGFGATRSTWAGVAGPAPAVAPLPSFGGRVQVGAPPVNPVNGVSDHTIVIHRVVGSDPDKRDGANDDVHLPAQPSVGTAPVSPALTTNPPADLEVSYENGPYDKGNAVDDVDSDLIPPEDSTVVLPLSGSQRWRHSDGKPAGATRP